jgi:hypothetical protein
MGEDVTIRSTDRQSIVNSQLANPESLAMTISEPTLKHMVTKFSDRPCLRREEARLGLL